MSIVITVIDHTLRNLYMYGDKRRSVPDDNEGFDRFDDVAKIFKLKEDLFIGITGVYDTGIAQYNHLMKFVDQLPVFSILELAGLAQTESRSIHGRLRVSTLIIAGKDDDGKLFIWTRRGNEKPVTTYNAEGNIAFVIATFDEKVWSFANDQFINNLANYKLPNYEISIEDMIIKVSEIDPSVSASFDSLRLSI